MEIPFTIKTLSGKTRVPKETLRGWLKRRLFEAVGRNPQNHPVFNSETVERVKLIRRCRKKGYEMAFIRGKSNQELQQIFGL